MSEIRATTISDLAGTGPATLTGQYAAKAWVNFNGTGTVAIRESANVTSITDIGTGTYTVNFTTAMLDANYAVAGFSTFAANDAPASAFSAGSLYAPTTTSTTIKSSNTTSGGTQDSPYVNVSITR